MKASLSIIALIIYVAIITWVGIRYRKSKDGEEYFLASRQLPAWLLAITFIASWWGGGSAIDLADQAYKEGISTFWIYGVPVLISTFLMFLFAKAIRSVSHITQPQMMRARYGKTVALMLSVFILIFMIINAAVQVIVLGRLLNALLDISYQEAAIWGTLAVLTYSLFGGFKGVVVTDLIQFVFFLFAALFLFFYVYDASGGFGSMLAHAERLQKDNYTYFFHNIGNHIAYVITFGAAWMIQANVWQRISAAKSPQSAQRVMLISFFVFIPLYLLITLTGMLSLPLYESLPPNGIIPHMIQQIDTPLLSILLFIGLCSAIMSTMDSLLNTAALTFTMDIYEPYLRKANSPNKQVLIGRLATVAGAALALYMGLEIRSVLKISWIGGDFLASGAFVPLLLGFVWKKGSNTAALSAMVFGLLFSSYNLAIALGAPLPSAWEIASAQQAMIGILGALFIFVAVSIFGKAKF